MWSRDPVEIVRHVWMVEDTECFFFQVMKEKKRATILDSERNKMLGEITASALPTVLWK